jgi:hypothetical protein
MNASILIGMYGTLQRRVLADLEATAFLFQLTIPKTAEQTP